MNSVERNFIKSMTHGDHTMNELKIILVFGVIVAVGIGLKYAGVL